MKPVPKDRPIPRRDIGAFSAYHPGASRPGAVKLSSNENPLGVSPRAFETLTSEAASVVRYPDGAARELRLALAARRGVGAENIIVGNGSDEVLSLLAGAYMEPTADAVIARHTFSQYAYATRLFGGIPRTVAMPDLRTDTDAMADAVGADTRIVFVCSPNNPTGEYLPEAPLRRLLDRVPATVLVVVDHAYAEYATAADFADAGAWVGEYPNLVVLRTFSKIYGLAGLRVGYGIADEAIISNLQRVKSPFNVGILAQAAATAALEDDDFVRRSIEENEASKVMLQRDCPYPVLPTQGNFLCIDVGTDADDFAGEFASRGVTIRPLASFGLPTHVRITIPRREQVARVLEILHELKNRKGR